MYIYVYVYINIHINTYKFICIYICMYIRTVYTYVFLYMFFAVDKSPECLRQKFIDYNENKIPPPDSSTKELTNRETTFFN